MMYKFNKKSSDIKMTLRYAHLAPEHKANAVAKITLRD